jgi:hypothetical protein
VWVRIGFYRRQVEQREDWRYHEKRKMMFWKERAAEEDGRGFRGNMTDSGRNRTRTQKNWYGKK